MSRSIGQVAYHKPLSRCDMEELAAHQRSVEARGGVLFARGSAGEQKYLARERILELFTPALWPYGLKILTMPGVDWRFERKLLGNREPTWMTKRSSPKRTFISAVENDRAIYHGAIADMPGANTLNALIKVMSPPPSFCERAVKTRFVPGGFFFTNVDDLMRETTWSWDAVWLDYTGPMTPERLRLIKGFYHRSVRHILIVTSLKARFNKATSIAIERAGSHSAWLRKYLEGEVLHDIEYFDTSPMAQLAVRHTAAPAPSCII